MKKISDKCLSLVKEFEGCQLTAYQDEVGVWTIGYGITTSDRDVTGRSIHKGMKISKDTAEKWLKEALTKKYLPLVLKYDKQYNWNQNELDALVSFAYNIGSIKKLTANGTRSRKTIAAKMLEYIRAKGTVYNGLIRRRKAERALFLAPVKSVEEQKNPEEKKEDNRERMEGVKYFSVVKNKTVDSITTFLHNRGFGAGKPNLSKIASVNAESPEVREALFKLAQKGLLIKPDGLNKRKEN